MRRLAFLLRPGWIALAVVVIAFTYLCFSVLAPWQLGKNTKTSRENDQIQHSLTTEPVPLTTLLPQQDSSATDRQWRRVTATGHYLPDKQVVARLRVAEGDPAMEVLLPFVVDGGPTVLVDRGYVRPLPGSRVPPITPPPTAAVTITARLRDSEGPVLDKKSFVSDGVRQVYSIDTSQIADVDRHPVDRFVPATRRQPTRRTRCHRAASFGRGSVPVLRHPVDHVRRHRPDSVGLLRVFRGPGSPRRQCAGTATRGQGGADIRRRQAHRPLRPATLIPHAGEHQCGRLHRP